MRDYRQSPRQLEITLLLRCKTGPRSREQNRAADSTMLFLYATVLLVLAGGIQSTPVPEKFSFVVTTKPEVLCVYVGFSVSINCKTNDPRASVSLSTPKSLSPSRLPSLKKRITIKGQIFTINNAILHDGGQYYCIAEKNGQRIKREVILLVSGIPEVEIIPYMNRRVARGSEFNYTCQAVKTWCGFNLQWSKTSGPMTGVQITYSNKSKVWETHLKVKKADSSHSGYYTCKLYYNHSPIAKADHEVQVKVVDREKVKIVLSSDSSIWVDNIGQEVEIICIATGFPFPTITWRKDGEVLGNCQKCANKGYVITRYGLKIVHPRYPDDIGNFSCEARNDKESERKYFQVYIPVTPVIMKTRNRVYVWTENENAAFLPCKLQQGATPRVQFSWLWKSGQLKVPVTGMNKVKVITYENRTESVLKIELPVAKKLSFECTAKNSKGSDAVVFTLAKKG